MASKVTKDAAVPSNAEAPSKPAYGEDDWQVRNDLDTITKAHDILQDAEKMPHIHKLAGRHVKALSGIAGLGGEKPLKPFTSLKDVKAHAAKLNMKK